MGAFAPFLFGEIMTTYERLCEQYPHCIAEGLLSLDNIICVSDNKNLIMEYEDYFEFNITTQIDPFEIRGGIIENFRFSILYLNKIIVTFGKKYSSPDELKRAYECQRVLTNASAEFGLVSVEVEVKSQKRFARGNTTIFRFESENNNTINLICDIGDLAKFLL